MFRDSESRIRLFTLSDDQPRIQMGSLIPRKRARSNMSVVFSPVSARKPRIQFVRVLYVVVGVFAFALIATTSIGVISRANVAAAPTVFINGPEENVQTELAYGPQESLSQNTFFTETRDAFIDGEMTFIEVDLSAKQLRLFERGVLLQSAEILRTPEDGSWWDTPSGLYAIEEKTERSFTSLGQVYLPWQLRFQGNFLIHGVPEYPDGSTVAADFKNGGIRLNNESAQALFDAVKNDTPVLVHAAIEPVRDTFVYEPQVPEIDALHYFIADIENGTILAASDLDEPAPIASVTKLMTAVVAAESIDLDGRIWVTSPTFVTSLIPRLSERSSVSMYSLLQLLLVESSNEAAETIAGEVGREEFIEAMNAKARQLGMLETNFADPSGLSAENVSSLGDLYKLTKYIYENRSFIFEMTANTELDEAEIGGDFGGLINFNEIEDMDSFVGGKVGETNAAGQTSVSLHRIPFGDEERTLAVILLGSNGRTEDIRALLEYVDLRYGR